MSFLNLSFYCQLLSKAHKIMLRLFTGSQSLRNLSFVMNKDISILFKFESTYFKIWVSLLILEVECSFQQFFTISYLNPLHITMRTYIFLFNHTNSLFLIKFISRIFSIFFFFEYDQKKEIADY